MVMPVDSGGAYFGFYSDFGDVSRGEAITYSSAVASAAAEGARDVADLAIPSDLGDPTILPGHPKIQSATGSDVFIEIVLTYDNGFWGDGTTPWYPSNLLVELLGSGATSFVVGESAPLKISHYVSSDGGQSIYLSATGGASLFDNLTRVKIWRAAVFPGDPVEPAEPFWAGFVGTHEIVGEGAPIPGGGVAGATVVDTLPFTTTLGALAAGAVRWFKVTAGAGYSLFTTYFSPEGLDTHIALYDESGVLVADNDDIDPGLDYRSEIEALLTAGTYYLAVGGHGATVGNGFTFTGSSSLAAGAVLNIETF